MTRPTLAADIATILGISHGRDPHEFATAALAQTEQPHQLAVNAVAELAAYRDDLADLIEFPAGGRGES